METEIERNPHFLADSLRKFKGFLVPLIHLLQLWNKQEKMSSENELFL